MEARGTCAHTHSCGHWRTLSPLDLPGGRAAWARSLCCHSAPPPLRGPRLCQAWPKWPWTLASAPGGQTRRGASFSRRSRERIAEVTHASTCSFVRSSVPSRNAYLTPSRYRRIHQGTKQTKLSALLQLTFGLGETNHKASKYILEDDWKKER